MGLLLCRKHKVSSGKPTRGSGSHEGHTVVGADSVDDPQHATYALVQKVVGADSVDDPLHATYALVQNPKKEKGEKAVDPDDVTYAAVRNQRKKKGSARTKASSPEETVIYSSIY
ncbi:uncharacterized protein AB9X84_015517 [Acanthopagrus schlegelii]